MLYAFIYISQVNNHKLKLQMWDTAGQERFASMVCGYLILHAKQRYIIIYYIILLL